jgi:hypothetical protein
MCLPSAGYTCNLIFSKWEVKLLIAVLESKEGKKILVLGLEQKQIDRLVDDRPIHKDLGEEGVTGLEDWDLMILGPEDCVRFVAQFSGV